MAGPPPQIQNDYYSGIAGPSSFGTGGFAFPQIGSGDRVGVGVFLITGDKIIAVPVGYVSKDPLAATSTLTDATLAGLGITPGTYTWTWGSAALGTFDSFTLKVGVPVPGPASLALLGPGLVGLAAARRARRAA